MMMSSHATIDTYELATDVLRQGILFLQKAQMSSASLDARLLMQHVLGVSREKLLEDQDLALNEAQVDYYKSLVEKRAQRQPIAQLIEKREFWSLTFKVTADTLDPRADSETIIEAAAAFYRDRRTPDRILDFGTGTGCLLLSLLHQFPNAKGTGVDISAKALEVAQENANNLGMADRSSWLARSWGNDVEGEFDLIVSNPPYIPTQAIAELSPEVAQYEPHLALDGGPDGMRCYRAVMPHIKRLLASGGLALLEIGAGQAAQVQAIARDHGLQLIGKRDDMGCITRCVMLAHAPAL